MAYTIALPSLSPREAVADCLYRSVTGIDGNDPELFASSVLPGKETSVIVGEHTIQGADTITEYIMSKIMPLHTTHFITNVRVDLKDGADTASLTANAMAYHYRPEDAYVPEAKAYVTGGLYYLDLVKDSDGLWKIKKWTLKMNWTEGERSVIFGEQGA
ncbi:hypothetical protein NA57DRAFT_69883 [Rhizodiscina lignyota]|uniref:SnoaL-like domain-containing protein n=1 Tax=Rhizodiscina lignyota TaxID=1504668 RepID=A0A9P4ILD7_9PEZI|nr:hypothetical protein NA57DRAFT_69883 [Rhizodiscina lignyota]